MRLQLLQDNHLTPAEESCVEFKGRVLCGGPQQCDGPILNVREECVLMGRGRSNHGGGGGGGGKCPKEGGAITGKRMMGGW